MSNTNNENANGFVSLIAVESFAGGLGGNAEKMNFSNR
jgi:hypothetical protein